MEFADTPRTEGAPGHEEILNFVSEVYQDPSQHARISANITSEKQMPLSNRQEYNPRLLREIFPPEKSEGAYMTGIIAIHGNEPQIMTAAVAAEINQILKENSLPGADIVLPSVYGETTIRILKEEFPALTGRIFLSDRLGSILKQTEFSPAGYQAHLKQVADKQPQVSEEVLDFFSRPFEATSLDGAIKEFKPEGKRLEINAGANVTTSEQGQQNTHFIFPVLLSEMLERTQTDPTIGRHFDPAILEKVTGIAHEFEARYRTTQIPYIHTLYGEKDYDASGKILTPPFKKPLVAPDMDIPENKGIYIMSSGSGIGQAPIEAQAEEIQNQGYEVLFPSWLKLDFGKAALPDLIYHPNVVAVMGRPGWGIGWISQVAEKPLIAMPHLWFDAPEMHFNIRALEASGLGMEFQPRTDLIQMALQLQPRIHEINEKMRKDLNLPEGTDGIRYAAENIVKSMMEDVAKRLPTSV